MSPYKNQQNARSGYRNQLGLHCKSAGIKTSFKTGAAPLVGRGGAQSGFSGEIYR